MQPVTVIIERKVRPGREAEYERSLRDVFERLSGFAGYLGMDVIQPTRPGGDYVVIFRFDSYDHLRTWETSAARRDWLLHIRPLVINERIERVSGLEFMFNRGDSRPPRRWKQLILTWVILFPLSYVSVPVFNALTPFLPPLGHVMLNTLILLALMSYVIMPVVTRVFARWLYAD